MGADYSFYVKSIATCTLTFFVYNISVLASVEYPFIYIGTQLVECFYYLSESLRLFLIECNF